MYKIAKYKKIISALIFVSMFASSFSRADSKPEVAVIDINKIFADSKAGKSLEDAFKKKRESEESSLRKTQETLVKDGEELKKQQGVLAADAFEKKRKVHEGKVAEFQLAIQKSQEVFETARNDSVGVIHDKIQAITKSISQKQGLKIVLVKPVVFYNDDSLDVTSQVLKILDSELAKVEVKFPAK